MFLDVSGLLYGFQQKTEEQRAELKDKRKMKKTKTKD